MDVWYQRRETACGGLLGSVTARPRFLRYCADSDSILLPPPGSKLVPAAPRPDTGGSAVRYLRKERCLTAGVAFSTVGFLVPGGLYRRLKPAWTPRSDAITH